MYTSGPWQISGRYKDGACPPSHISGADLSPIVDLYRNNPHVEGNARLIAQAPAMLDALQECVERLEEISRFTNGEWHSGSTLQIAKEAITAAIIG